MNGTEQDGKKGSRKHAVRISDGLGNQFFQYAFAYALQRRTGDPVLIDPLFWGTSLRKYQLDAFQTTMKNRLVSNGLDYFLGAGPRNGRKFKDLYRQHLIRRHYTLIREKEATVFDPDAQSPAENSFFLGFWQSPQYFDDYEEDLRKELTRVKPPEGNAAEWIQRVDGPDTVSLHIRRTDYVRAVGNAAIRMGYYDEALSVLDRLLGSYQLFVFSDDKEFARSQFPDRDFVMLEGLSDLDEFEVMRSCRHHIMANSTFSWWAAYLGNRDGITIAPRVGMWSGDFFPDNWKVLDAEV